METVSFISDDIEEIKKEQKKQQAIDSLLPSFMGVKLLLIRRRLFALFARLRRFSVCTVSIGSPAKLGCLL